MLIWCTGFLASLTKVAKTEHIPWATNNAIMNSYSMHARNLIDFLYLRSLRKDRSTDIIVEDFITFPNLTDILPEISFLLQEAKHKADKQVAHLTTVRIQFEESGKEWKFVDIAQDIIRGFNTISNLFPLERTGSAFLALISDKHLIVPFLQTAVIQNEQARNIGVTIRLGTRESLMILSSKPAQIVRHFSRASIRDGEEEKNFTVWEI